MLRECAVSLHYTMLRGGRKAQMISVIVIGRNEGERLEACLTSAQRALRMLSYELIYV